MNAKKLIKTTVLLILTTYWLFWYLHYRDLLYWYYNAYSNSWWLLPTLYIIIAVESWMLFSLAMLTYMLTKVLDEVIR